jgi:amino acid transporter
VWSVWACCAIAFVLALWSRAYNVIVAISTIGLYASYGLPIVLALRARRTGRCAKGPFSLGRASPWVNAIAIVWVVFITVLFVLPPNERTGITFGVLLLLLLLGWLFWSRERFRGPAGLNSQP